MPHFECQEGIYSSFDRIFCIFCWGSLLSLFVNLRKQTISPKKHPTLVPLYFAFLPNLMLFLSSYNSRAYRKTWQILLPHILQQKEAYLPLAVHLPTCTQVKEILKKHASIRAICHLDIKVVDFSQEINASIVRQRKKNIAMDVSFLMKLE